MIKRILSWGLILSLLLTLLPVSAMAAEENRSEDGQVTADTATEADIDTANLSTYTVEDDTTSVVLEAQPFTVRQWTRLPAATWC